MSDQPKPVSLTEEQRSALQAICRRRKVDALVWKRARAFLLLDEGEDARTVCRILDIGPTVLTEWKLAFAGTGLSFFGLKDYSQRQGHLFAAQETALTEHFTNNPASSADEVCAYILAEYGQSYCTSGAVKLMHRLGFVYKKPQSLPAQADEAKQEAFIAYYEALMTGLGDDEMVMFSDAVHPTHQSRPAHGWFPKDQKTAIKANSGRKRLNIQGALDLGTFQFTFVEAEKINAQTTQQMLEKLERNNPTMTTIHVFLDNARYHHAKILQPWLSNSKRKIKLHFLPTYAPHLNPIERLWGVMHKWVTHNQHYATFNQFTEAILDFFRKTLPDKWQNFRDTVTDNFRVVSFKDYKIVSSQVV
ncbi:MAG: IS630 family transposase [Hyphomicrobiales bacterium]|nr:IS630 family transposase [Hyphomicrobiales bacterium]